MKKILVRRTLYPGAINLPSGKPILFKIDEREFGVHVQRIFSALKIVDFENSIKKEMVGPNTFHFSIQKSDFTISQENVATTMLDASDKEFTTLIIDLKNGPRTLIPVFYTDLIIYFFDDVLNSLNDDVEAFTSVAVEHFINMYRQASNDVFVRTPSQNFYERTFFLDSQVKLETTAEKISLKDFVLPEKLFFAFKTFQHMGSKESYPLPHDDQEASWTKLKNLAEGNDLFFKERQILIDSFSKLILNNDFRQAFLEAFIIIETTISKWVKEKKLQSGVSKSKLDEFETEIGISYKINIEIPVLAGSITDKDRELLGQLNWARKIRNKIVHDSYTPTAEESLQAINLVPNLFEFIKKRTA